MSNAEIPAVAKPIPDLKPWFQTIADLPPVLDWDTFFAQPGPVEVDIGSGRGLFVYNASLHQPERNWVGLELDFKEGRRAARRLMKRQAGNARIIGGDARVVLTQKIPEHSVEAAHVYFPDPWWKKRHMGRRLFTEEFTYMLARIVKPGGLVHSWTDVGDYFEVIQGLMDNHPLFEILPPPPEREATHDMDYQTSFERKKRQDGWVISRGLWKRKPLDASA